MPRGEPNSVAAKAALALSWVFEVALNAYCGLNKINGEDNASVSARYDTYITPAGYAFAIWSVIFLLQGFLVLHALLRDDPALTDRYLGAWSLLMVAGGLWSIPFVFFWLKTSLLIMFIILGCLLVLYLETYPNYAHAFPELSARFWCAKAAVSLHLGWISVATIANVAIVCTDMGWNKSSEYAVTAALVMLSVAAALAFAGLLRRNDIVFASVFIWALVAIRAHQRNQAVRDWATGLAGAVAGAVVFVILRALPFPPRGSIPLE